MRKKGYRWAGELGVVLFVTLAVGWSVLQVASSASASGANSEAWRLAPPPPQIAERDRIAELRWRRQEVLKRVGEKGLLVLLSAEQRVYTNDVDYHYRQENNLYYLTGIRQQEAVLVLVPGAKRQREILFMPPRDTRYEIWNGRMLSQEEARTQSGVEEVRDARELAAFLTQLLPEAGSALPSRGAKITPDKATLALWQEDFATVRETFAKGEGALHLLLPPGADQREYRQEAELAQQLKRAMGSLRIVPAHPIFAELRLIKSPIEQALLQHAVDITSEAFHRVFAMVGQARYEYEVQAEFEYTFRRRNADFWGYPCIVGAGANATTLHYITSQDRLDDESLLLMDCAAEFDHYTADITRTIPVDGRFSKEQAEIYQIVYDAQQASIARVRPGNLVGSVMDAPSEKRSVQGVTAEIIKDGLLRLGLITSKENNEFRIWYMHGSSHWIGMNVHDVGSYQTPLAPGMVLTVEPGIYIRPDALDQLPQTPENRQFITAVRPAFEKYKGIGVRIEDDILVTEGAPRVMSSRIPSRLDEVEAVIARLSGELRRSGWPQAAPRKRP